MERRLWTLWEVHGCVKCPLEIQEKKPLCYLVLSSYTKIEGYEDFVVS